MVRFLPIMQKGPGFNPRVWSCQEEHLGEKKLPNHDMDYFAGNARWRRREKPKRFFFYFIFGTACSSSPKCFSSAFIQSMNILHSISEHSGFTIEPYIIFTGFKNVLWSVIFQSQSCQVCKNSSFWKRKIHFTNVVQVLTLYKSLWLL